MIPPRPHCPCDGLRGYQQMRATVLGLEDFPPFVDLRRYELRAEEILSDTQGGEASLRAGDRFGGYWQGELACGGDRHPDIATGTQVLAFYRRGMQDGQLCCEYIACSDACPRQQDDDGPASTSPQEACRQQCETQTANACSEHYEEAVMRGDLMLIPWGDEFVVGTGEHGETATITEADLHALTLDRDACMSALDDRYDALHPPEPASNMDDDSADPPHPTLPQGMTPVPPQPSTPMSMPETPPVSATPPASPDAGVAGMLPPAGTPAVNPAGPAGGPPSAHPEEVRVRCQ